MDTTRTPRRATPIRRGHDLVGERTDMLNRDRRRTTLRRYQWMFKVALSVIALGVLVSFTGVVTLPAGSDPALIAWGMLLASLSTLTAYKILLSTVRLLEADSTDRLHPGES